VARGHNRRPTVAITFDDGYADNFSFAIPLLLRHDIPFTYFVASRNVLETHPFDHDVCAGTPLRPNSVEELRSMAAAGVEIGSHTRTHADLGTVSAESELRDQLLGSKDDLEDALDVEIRYFAFPFGLPVNMTTQAFRTAIEAGYHGVCSAYGAYNLPGDDPFHIRRIHADPEMIRLKNWLTIDRRKLTVSDPFDPGDYQVAPLQLITDGASHE
jgi:peptidoglycan/xylan/chitin deacetylase (PgdA/CDA1 family)